MVLLILLICPALLSTKPANILMLIPEERQEGRWRWRKEKMLLCLDFRPSSLWLFPLPQLQFSRRTKCEGLGGWEERSHISKRVETRIRKKIETHFIGIRFISSPPLLCFPQELAGGKGAEGSLQAREVLGADT